MKTWLDAFIETLEDSDQPTAGDAANFAVAVIGWAIYFWLVIGVLP